MRTSTSLKNLVLTASLFALGLGLAGCGGIEKEAKYPTGLERNSGDANDIYNKQQGIFGTDDGLNIFGGGSDDDEPASGIAVNSFLWRATLDTVSFMPLSSADPFGGVILTDWYQPDPEIGERFKVNVFILGRQLRSDGIRVRTFKQRLSDKGWVDQKVGDETAIKLEDTILTRARQLRIAQQ